MGLSFDKYIKRFHGDVYLYGNASHGFYEIMTWLQKHNPRENPNIIMPVYIPAKLYRIVLAAGYEPRFYEIFGKCEFNTNEIATLIDENTQAVFGVHYFGIPSPLRELKRLTMTAGIYLIEDCAHSINSQYGGDELGTIGDFAIFSVRKMLQLPSGGFLAFNRQPWEFSPSYTKRVRSIYTACKYTKIRSKYLYYRLTRGRDPLNLAWVPGTGYIDFSDEQVVNVKQMSWLGERYTKSVDYDKISRMRRANYQFLSHHLSNLPFLQVLMEDNGIDELSYHRPSVGLPKEGWTPYSFPVLAPRGGRNSILEKLKQNGIGCGMGWPEAPFDKKRFTGTKELSERLFELPIHQGISRPQLQRMVNILSDYAGVFEPLKSKTGQSARVAHLN